MSSKILFWRILFFQILFFSFLTLNVRAITPEEMSYLDPSGRQMSVIDPHGYLSADVRQKVETQLENLRKQYSVEVVIVLPSEIGDMNEAQWCEQLFSRWKIGKADKDNGLLVMISPGSKAAFIMPGYGMEGVFTDIACSRIYREIIVPAMKENNVAGAVEGVTQKIVSVVEDPAVAEELRSTQNENMTGSCQTLDISVFWTFIQYVVALIFLISLILFLYYCRKSRYLKSNYEKAEFWRSRLTVLAVLGVCSFGTGLIFFVLGYIVYRSWRMRPLSCSTCGHKMKRLPEDKDNELLSDSQDFEEQLKTVDYDVWECPQCGTIERFPFKSSQKKYTECPDCHTVAMSLESDSVVRPSTIKTVGEGVKIYSCKYCHNKLRRPYLIPKKEDPTAALAAAAVIGASGRNRGGFGGGFGGGGFGGFGGGSTGGGGAGGRW